MVIVLSKGQNFLMTKFLKGLLTVMNSKGKEKGRILTKYVRMLNGLKGGSRFLFLRRFKKSSIIQFENFFHGLMQEPTNDA